MKKFKDREWVTPNRMKFESGYRTFDRQVDLIAAGNVVSNVQHSSVIRPYSDTNDGLCAAGRCRRFDIDCMSHGCSIPLNIRNWLADNPEAKCWLYRFRLRDGADVCWALTDYGHESVIRTFVSGRRYSAKHEAVLNEALKYVVRH